MCLCAAVCNEGLNMVRTHRNVGKLSELALIFCNQQQPVYHCNGDCSGFFVRWELNCYILCVDVNFMVILIHYFST